MKKENFVTLIMGTAGMLLFSLGLCMCLVEQWGAFNQGVAAGAAGAAILAAALAVRRRMQGKPAPKLTAKAAGAAALGIAGALTFGAGMCMTMVWEGLLLPGIAAGIAGIVLLLFLIPVCKGLQ